MVGKMLVAFLLVCLMSDIRQVRALEEPSPEVFLQPRNFNPHPYELGYDPTSGDRQVSRLREYANQIDVFTGHHNRGPVLFPRNRQPDDNRVTNDPYVVQKLKDAHPYAGVVAKQKKKYGLGLGRFATEAEHVNPQVYRALAAHGAKVLKVPQAKELKNVPNLDVHYDYDDESKKNYAFSYKVLDHLTGDDFSHSQSQNSHATNGEYRVKLPDGRVQTVSYTADKNGYKADVSYSSNKPSESLHQPEPHPAYNEPAHHRFAAPSSHQHLSPVPLPVRVPFYANSLLHHHQQHQQRLQQYRDDGIALKSHAHDFINQHLITDEDVDEDEQVDVGPTKPTYYDDGQHPELVLILPHKYRDDDIHADGGLASEEKVQLLPNIHEQKLHEHHGKFIAATLAPYIVANGQPHSVQALSTLAPDLDKFNPVYIDAPKYKLPTTTIHH